MKALEAKFFGTVGSSVLAALESKEPKRVKCGLHSWSISNFLYPVMEEGEFAWMEEVCFLVGTREQYLQWLSEQDNPNFMLDTSFFPLGLYCVKVGGGFIHARCLLGQSIYCAYSIDFVPLFWALEGIPSEIDYERENNRMGTGVYRTFCNHYGIRMPRFWVDDEEPMEEENNFLQKYFK